MRRLAFAALMLAAPAGAQELPPIDPRIVSVPVDQGGMFHLQTAPDMAQTVLFKRGERIASIILSDPTAFDITVASSGDSLALQATRSSAFGVMTVRTDARTYEFELTGSSLGRVPAVVRLVDAPSYQPMSPPLEAPLDSGARYEYRLSGSKTLRPTAIHDDGHKTYIEWERDQAMPATFALGPTGDEQMVDGHVRGGIYTIDRVYETLIFRIDKEKAKARRREESDGHG